MEDIVLFPAGSLHGRLQRGRGCAARAATASRGSGDLVHDCVRHDPRWDVREARGLYYARLIVDLELSAAPIADHLFDPGDRADTEPDRTNLALDVLGRLVRLGRPEVAGILRRYAREGGNWFTALQRILDLDDPALADGLDEVAMARCDDRDLAVLCRADGVVTRAWADRHPRIAAARRPAAPPPEPRHTFDRQTLTRHDDAGLAALARGHGERATAAILELGRRRSPLVLDLAEELLPGGDHDGPLCRAVRDLGDGALPRARAWVTEHRSYADVGVDVLAAHGAGPDLPALLAALDVAVEEEDWDLAAVPADGLGRLASRAAIPLLLRAWEWSACSHLRVNLLGALCAIDPHVAEPYLVEALWDCEDGVRWIAAGSVPLEGETRDRLRRLGREAGEEPSVRSAAAARLAADGCATQG